MKEKKKNDIKNKQLLTLGKEFLLKGQISFRPLTYFTVTQSLTFKHVLPESASRSQGDTFPSARENRTHSNREKRSKYDNLSRISRIDASRPLPLSDGQFRLAFLENLNPDFSSYNWLISFVIEDPLNLIALEKSIKHLILRHDSFRTGINLENKTQVIIHPSQIKWNLEKKEYLFSGNNLTTFISNECEQYAKLKFNLEEPPLLRSKVITLNQNNQKKHLWLCTIHHSIFDGYSQGIFLNELKICYSMYLREVSYKQVEKNLPELTIQYPDYCHWLANFPESIKGEEVKYWQENLKSAETLELPTDFARPPIKTFTGDRVTFSIPQEIANTLKALSLSCETTFFSVLLASFQCLLYHYTGQEDICTGTMTANRKKGDDIFQQLSNVIGFIANTVVIRTKIDPELTINKLIKIVHDSVKASIYENSDLTFGEVVTTINPPRDPSRNLLFETLFVLQGREYQELNLPGTVATPFEEGWKTSRFDLTLEIRDKSKDELSAFFEYNNRLFKKDTIERMVQNYLYLLVQFTQCSDKKLCQLTKTTPAERQLIASFNSPISYNQVNTLPQIFNQIVELFPNKIALVFDDLKLTYSQLDQEANVIANFLLNNDIKSQSLIAICMTRSLEAIIAILGIIKAGCVVVCLEDTQNQINTIYKKIDALQPVMILTHDKTEDLFTELRENNEAQTFLLTKWSEIAATKSYLTTACPEINASMDDTVLVSMTSGTTGPPKSIPTTHRGWSNWIDYFREQMPVYNIDSNSRVYQGATFTFDAAFWEIWVAFGVAGTLYLTDSTKALDPRHLEIFFRNHAITVATFTPTFGATLPPQAFPSVLTIFWIGEALSIDLVNKWLIRNRVVGNGYGPSEVTAGVTMKVCARDEPISIGKPIINTTVHILDQYLQPVPIGCSGEIYIGGVGVAKGYLNDPQKTELSFINNPFTNSGEKLYRTGDKGRYLATGFLEYKGRINGSRQIKLHGVRVELQEIEEAMKIFPGVEQAFVKVITTLGEPFLTGYYLSEDNNDLDLSELEQFLQQRGLSSVKIPSAFIKITEVPLTKNGKLDEKALPIPAINSVAKIDTIGHPQNNLEKELYAIWKEIFPHVEISTFHNFYDLGGNSLKISHLISKLNQLILKNSTSKISYPDLPAHFSINSLAKCLEKKLEKLTNVPYSSSMLNLYEQIFPDGSNPVALK